MVHLGSGLHGGRGGLRISCDLGAAATSSTPLHHEHNLLACSLKTNSCSLNYNSVSRTLGQREPPEVEKGKDEAGGLLSSKGGSSMCSGAAPGPGHRPPLLNKRTSL